MSMSTCPAWARTLRGYDWRSKAAEASRSQNGSSLTGSLELGGLADGGDAETGAGAELGMGIAYRHPAGLDIHARGHVLLAHEDSEFEQWGAGLTVNFDWGAQGEGLFFAFAPTWGTPSTGAEGMWSSTRAAQALLSTGGAELGMNLDTRVGYGMNLSNGKGLLTLFSEMGKPNGGTGALACGNSTRAAPNQGVAADSRALWRAHQPHSGRRTGVRNRAQRWRTLLIDLSRNCCISFAAISTRLRSGKPPFAVA